MEVGKSTRLVLQNGGLDPWVKFFLVCLGFKGDEILPSSWGDEVINHYFWIPILNNQDSMEVFGSFFFVAHVTKSSFFFLWKQTTSSQ